MRNAIILGFVLTIATLCSAQWNTDLSANLVIADNGRIENVIYDGNGYYLTWQEGSGPFTHKVTRLNENGTPNWNIPLLAHNHDLGSFTVNLQHSAMDTERNFIRVSSYINNDGEFCCINKIDTSGVQLLNGEAGIEFTGLAMGFTLGASGNMYVLVNTDLKKVDPNGNVIWTTTLDPDHLNSRAGSIIESADGTVGVAYFVPGGGNPAYGKYYIARFDALGNRTTVGSVLISPALCSFYRPSFFTANAAGDYYFIGFDTNSSVSFVQHLMGDVPMVGGNGTPLDNAANSSFITATMANDSIYAFYQYNWNSFDEGGLKMQAIDLATGAHAYPQGNTLYTEADGVKPLQNSAVFMGDHAGCLMIENATQTVRLLEVSSAGISTSDLFTSTSAKGLAAISSFDQINPEQKQLVAFLEDYRTAVDQSSAVAQNLLIGNVGIMGPHTLQSPVIYPNPAHQSARFTVDESWLGCDCAIYNSMGQRMQGFTIRQCNTTLNLESMSAGMYHVCIQNSTHKISRTLVIQ